MAKSPRKPPTFKTRRLIVRPWLKGDLEAAYTLYSDAGNLRYWNTPAHTTLDQTKRVMRWHVAYRPQYYTMWAVEEKKSGRVIGMVNYHHRFTDQRRVDVGWLILRSHQGKGLTAEAMRPVLKYLFDKVGVHKVEALIMPANKPSQGLARKLGFRKEGGPIRDRWQRNGKWHSVLIYGLIAGEEK
jgi:ribosomal-protein-alanine N-acetyltransferase